MVLDYREEKRVIIEQRLANKQSECDRLDDSNLDVREMHKAKRALSEEIVELEETLHNWDKTPEEIAQEKAEKEKAEKQEIEEQGKKFDILMKRADKLFEGGAKSPKGLKWVLEHIDFEIKGKKGTFVAIPMTERDEKAGKAYKKAARFIRR